MSFDRPRMVILLQRSLSLQGCSIKELPMPEARLPGAKDGTDHLCWEVTYKYFTVVSYFTLGFQLVYFMCFILVFQIFHMEE